MFSVTERKELYAFFAGFFSYPDADLLVAVHDPRRIELLGRLPGAPPLPPAAHAATLAELEVAYTALFINRLGGVTAPPYGSVYLDGDGQLMGTSSRKAAEWYLREGLKLELAGEPPDHLPTELEFLYYLVDQEEQALGRRDVAAAREWTTKQAAFGSEHLLAWGPQFAARVAAAATAAELYRWGAGLLAAFCRQESEWLRRLQQL